MRKGVTVKDLDFWTKLALQKVTAPYQEHVLFLFDSWQLLENGLYSIEIGSQYILSNDYQVDIIPDNEYFDIVSEAVILPATVSTNDYSVIVYAKNKPTANIWATLSIQLIQN